VGVAGTSGTGAGLGYEQQQLTGAQVSGTGGGDDQMGEGEDATHGQSRPRISTGGRRQSEGAAASHKGRGGIRSERPARERDISKGSTGEAKGSGSSRSRSPGRELKDHQPRSR
jgi:hypothetical protein